MKHVQDFVNFGARAGRKIPYHPFKLDDECIKKPSRFEFEIKVENYNYAYGFSADANHIHDEWLYIISKSKDKLVFERNCKSGHDSSDFDISGLNFNSSEDIQFLLFTTKGTPSNRLFLTECRERNVLHEVSGEGTEHLMRVSDWFESKLNIVFPDSKYSGLEIEIQKNKQFSDIISNFLKCFDTGIENVFLKNISLDNAIDIPSKLRKEIIDDLEDSSSLLLAGPHNTRYLISKSKGGDIKASKLMTTHLNNKNKEVHFDINHESDGTQRLIDMIPGFMDVFVSDKTYIIDELDRSLHSDIATAILEMFLSVTEKINSQLILTAHETNLLDQDLIRKDEVWFLKKNRGGESELYSLEEFKLRFDKDLQKDYLNGRFGGVPFINDIAWNFTNA